MVSGIVSGQRDFRARGYCLQQHNAEGFAARRGEDRDIGAAQQGWFGRFLNEPGEGDRRVEPGSSASAFLEQRAFAGHRHMGAGGEEPVLFAVFDCIKQDIRALAFDETAEEHNMRGDGFTVQCADIDSVSPIAHHGHIHRIGDDACVRMCGQRRIARRDIGHCDDFVDTSVSVCVDCPKHQPTDGG